MTSLIDVVIGFLTAFCKELYNFIVFIISLWKKPKGYDASFTPSRKILSKANRGFSLGAYQSMDIKTSFQHLLVSAPSGIGKSSAVGIPTLVNLHDEGSLVVLDPAKELYKNIGHLYRDYTCYLFNFSDRTGRESDGWNPLPKEKADLPNFTARISTIVHGGSRDKFWEIQSGELLTTLAEPLYSLDPKFRTVANLLLLLNTLAAKEKLCNKFMAKYASPTTWLEYLAFHKNSDNTKASILSSAKATLSVFRQDHIQRITSSSTFQIKDLRREKSIVFIQTNPAELEKYKLLVSEFFNQLIGHILSDVPKENDENIFMILDEAGVYRIEALPLGIVQARKMRCGIMMLVQSEQQLYNLLSKEEASTIISNCSRLILTNAPLATAREISELSGRMQYKDEDGITRTRELITTDEVRSLKPNQGILISGHHRPSLITLTPHYADARMRKITSEPPPKRSRILPEDSIPFLDIVALLHNDVIPTPDE